MPLKIIDSNKFDASNTLQRNNKTKIYIRMAKGWAVKKS